MEVLITFQMEHLLSKERILEIYLNVIEWGPGIYGAEAAAQHYFHTSANALNVSEAAFLAAIIPSPVKWGRWPPGPYVSHRMNLILARAGFGSPPPEQDIPDLPEEAPDEMPVEDPDMKSL